METFERLEQEFGRWAGVPNVVACASGTAALHLALESLRLPPGSDVLVPDFTMIACARAVTLAGLVPVFVGCGDDLLMRPEYVAEAVTTKTAAIMPVHVYGRRCDMAAIHAVANRHDLFVVEDLAEAHGVAPHTDTDAACWSFYRNKIIAGEEGGAIAFKSPEAAALARSLRSLGFTPEHDFRHVPRGHNYRMSNAHASLILDNLGAVDANLCERCEIEVWYDAACPDGWRMPARLAPWVYDLKLPDAGKRDECVLRLRMAGVESRHGFRPMSEQTEYRACRLVGRNSQAVGSIVYLPIQPGVTTKTQVVKSLATIRQVCEDKVPA